MTRDALKAEDVRFTRVDCTYHYPVGTDEDAATWISCMEDACTVRFRGRGHYDPGMCAIRFGIGADAEGKVKASRRSTFKFYNKFRELQRHPMTCDHKYVKVLQDMACGVVRGEACYRGLELKEKGFAILAAWDTDTAWNLHRDWIAKMDISANVRLLDSQEVELPDNLRLSYRAWVNGEDCRALMPRRTFYHRRRQLLAYGIDISVPRTEPKSARRVVPILEVLSAGPAQRQEGEALFREMLRVGRSGKGEAGVGQGSRSDRRRRLALDAPRPLSHAR